MEDVSEKKFSRPITLSAELRKLRGEVAFLKRERETKTEKKVFQFPFKWRWKFNQAKSKSKKELALVLYLNKKNEIEPPIFLPIYDGNMIVYKNKAYIFDPRAIWRLRGVRGYPSVYLIKEIDRKPVMNRKGEVVFKQAAVSNMDIEEVKLRGDSTDSDELLIKAALKAQTSQLKGKVNVAVIAIIIIAIVGGLIYFLQSGAI